MGEMLPPGIFKEVLEIQKGEKELSPETAEVVATAMRNWAIEKGATHYTHWFHPLTGLTAAKHESFIDPSGDGRAAMKFSGKSLIKGEPDASSFPSGGLRATFEARGYTAWDLTSPAFLKQDKTGLTLCIPTAFISYNGQALDQKVPLLKSIEAVSKQALRVLRVLGNGTSKRVMTEIGAEQEYFLVDKKYYDSRPDLILTGRTVLGALPAKGQEMEDHYYGALKDKVADFMRELNHELWKAGVPAKIQHKEVAPNQFEIVPVFAAASAALDANQLLMETLQNVARRHGMEALLHEKPFAGVNGSGKHNNLSLATDDGINLFDPGEDPQSNARFLLFMAAVVEAVDRYALLLRASAACPGNDYRLGGYEAPPAIISIFFGTLLTEFLDNIASGKDASPNGAAEGEADTQASVASGQMKLGVTSLPDLPKDISDRNRTSPLAYTGKKFEFRMAGASQSIAASATYFNVALAQVLSDFADTLETILISGAADKHEAVQAVIKNSYRKHCRVVFNGNGYSQQWVAEAASRGLPNVANTVDALSALVADDTIALFESHKVLSREELESRYHIYLENYSKQINIEAGVTVDLAARYIFPAASSYAAELARQAHSLREAGAKAEAQAGLAKKICEGLAAMQEANSRLESELAAAQKIAAAHDRAKACLENVRPAMDEVRSNADALEKMVAKEAWPLPGYEELLFKL
ncbi:MAG: glutamine synthetase III [Spirochaetes bacterium]|nr:glutamine synthetase III [Spirochaetota bacterium]